MHKKSHQFGFTLVELIIVIVLMGVIGGMVSVFMKSPIDAYIDSARRAALTDVADTAVRRMGRDIRSALPNSIRTPSTTCVEFIPTKTGGRYRAEEKVAADNTSLDFALADSTFNMLASNLALPTEQRIAAADVIVVYNLGIPDSDAYQTTGNLNLATVAASSGSLGESGTPTETKIVITPSTQFPLASGSNRFHVVPGGENVVSYVCDLVTHQIYRTASTFANAASTSCTTSGALAPSSTRSVLASNVSSCSFDYSGSDLQRNALARMSMQFTESGETVSLQHEVHVNNTP
jgi:MSHA biogenesis protein MshO